MNNRQRQHPTLSVPRIAPRGKSPPLLNLHYPLFILNDCRHRHDAGMQADTGRGLQGIEVQSRVQVQGPSPYYLLGLCLQNTCACGVRDAILRHAHCTPSQMRPLEMLSVTIVYSTCNRSGCPECRCLQISCTHLAAADKSGGDAKASQS